MKDNIIYSIKIRNNKTIPCNLHYKYVRIIDEDDEGNQYRKTVKYMENTVTTSVKLMEFLTKQPKYVRNIVLYITKHLTYNQTVLELKNKEILKEFNDSDKMYSSDVTKGLQILKTEGIIQRIREREDYKNDNMFTQYDYFINPEYIFNGSINHIIKTSKTKC